MQREIAKKPTKRCIIFSYGPVPIPDQEKVEGGGLRCWGLAKGLRANDESVDITVAYHDSYKKKKVVTRHESINITAWNLSSIRSLMSDYDAVIVSYCMGDLSVAVADAIRPDQQLILDCYVPIYLEISARNSNDLIGEYHAFNNEINRWSSVLRRGDVFLCANENQKKYYQGVLSALGRINPLTYADEQILIVPYGIYAESPKVTQKPITEKLKATGAKGYKKILWFGAVYPWFDIRTLVEAIDDVNKTVPTKLVIVGAKNPFNAHPDFIRRYDELIDFINSNEKYGQEIILQDWVEFGDRANWYLDSDLVILINKTGDENELAWRTRLVDYVWADLPIITNGGDPLSEMLFKANAALKLDDLSREGLTKTLLTALSSSQKLTEIKNNLSKVRPNLHWNQVCKPLLSVILNGNKPTDFATLGVLEATNEYSATSSKVSRLVGKIRKVPVYYRKHGFINTYNTAKMVLLKIIDLKINKGMRPPKVIFVAHQLDTTGAPHVFIDLVGDFINQHPKTPIEFHTFNPTDNANVKKLNNMGITPKLHLNRDIGLRFSDGDVVVLNTVAFSETFKRTLLDALNKGVVRQILWYVHEDEPSAIFDRHETDAIKTMLNNDKITIFTAAAQTLKNYQEHFSNKRNIRLQTYRMNYPDGHGQVRKANDFDTARFILPGMVSDGRKGQLPILYAFIEFKNRFYDLQPSIYRDFSLTYIGVTDDFLSRQIIKHGERNLGKRFNHYRPMPHSKVLEYDRLSNVTICYSMRECLPLFVYEGMAAGHPILRNDSSGMAEQLEAGRNGFYLDSNDYKQVVETIEVMLNKNKTSNKVLASMSDRSHKIALKATQNSYTALIDEIVTSFNKNTRDNYKG